MAGTWESQNKVIPAAYINVVTNTPLSITPGDRGTVVIAQELSVGEDDEIYTITATEPGYPEGATAADKKLANLALQGANKVLLYKLPATHEDTDVETMLAALKTVDFNVLVYPFENTTAKQTIVTWIKAMQDDEGANVTAVLPNQKADTDYVINVVQGLVMTDGSELTAAETTAWVGGVTAGASITESNTGKIVSGAMDVKPRKTKTEMEASIKAGEFIFTVDRTQNVSVVADINSLTTVTPEKSEIMKQNRTVRTAYGIREDIANFWESTIKGKYDNDDEGRLLVKGLLVEYFKDLENRRAIHDFDPEQVTVEAGDAVNAVVITCEVHPTGSMEIAYITVYLS